MKIKLKLMKKWGEYAVGDEVAFDERKGRPLIANGTGVLVGRNIETAAMKQAQGNAKAKAKAEADAKRLAEEKAKSRTEAKTKAEADAKPNRLGIPSGVSHRPATKAEEKAKADSKNKKRK